MVFFMCSQRKCTSSEAVTSGPHGISAQVPRVISTSHRVRDVEGVMYFLHVFVGLVRTADGFRRPFVTGSRTRTQRYTTVVTGVCAASSHAHEDHSHNTTDRWRDGSQRSVSDVPDPNSVQKKTREVVPGMDMSDLPGDRVVLSGVFFQPYTPQ